MSHTVLFSNNSVEFDIQLDEGDTREILVCTWDEINKVDGQICTL